MYQMLHMRKGGYGCVQIEDAPAWSKTIKDAPEIQHVQARTLALATIWNVPSLETTSLDQSQKNLVSLSAMLLPDSSGRENDGLRV